MIRRTKEYMDSWTYRKQMLRGKSKSHVCNIEAVSEDQLLYESILVLPIKYREVMMLHFIVNFL